MRIYVILIETKIIYVISTVFKYEKLNEMGGGGVLKANKSLRIVNLIIQYVHYNIKRITSHFTLKSLS